MQQMLAANEADAIQTPYLVPDFGDQYPNNETARKAQKIVVEFKEQFATFATFEFFV